MNTKRKTPMRMCSGCRERREKSELIRVVRTPQGEICVDLRGKMSGRGAYICRDEACLSKAVKSRALQRSLECEIESDVFEHLKDMLAGGTDGQEKA